MMMLGRQRTVPSMMESYTRMHLDHLKVGLCQRGLIRRCHEQTPGVRLAALPARRPAGSQHATLCR